ncbi:MAG: DUF4835 family protein [Bacteroidaceae bacterium]|nr:DUF4835 family protein [Bacteroidaceae bacterium]
MIRRYTIATLFLLANAFLASAQELNAKVVINTAQLVNTNTEACETFREKAEEFLNSKQWTTVKYDEVERITCTFNITVNKYSAQDGAFECTLLLNTSRPVWGSSYTTPLYNTRDQHFHFKFDPADQLEYNPENLDNQLIALLAYYAHIIIGMDMDTFAPLGGTTVLQTAEDIVNKAQNLGYSGWSAFNESNNRFALLNDYMDGSMEAIRQMNYTYHRQGLDNLCDSTEKAHKALVESIELLDQARQARSMSNVPQLFTEYKKEELVNIFSKHENQEERERVYSILFAINPSQNNSWEKIKK